MKKVMFFFFALSIYSGYSATGQNTPPIWQSYFQGLGDNSDRFNKIIPDGHGNYLLAGYSIRQGNYRDFLTVKINSDGDTIWWRTKNGKGNADDEAIDIAVDSSSNIYVTGYSDDGNLNNDILLIKYDSNGSRLWDTTYNASPALDEIPVGMDLDMNGNIFIGGSTEPDTVSGSNDYITLKFDSTGALLWATTFSRIGVTSGKDEEAGIAVDTSGNVTVTGRSFNGTDDDIVTNKYNGITGQQTWSAIYNGGNGTDRGAGITIDRSGNVLVVGRNSNASNDDVRILKYNTAGVPQWSRAYNGPANQNDRGIAITTDSSNNVYAAGQSDVDNSSITDYDYVTIKYNSAGTLQWSRVEGSNTLQYDIPASIMFIEGGYLVVTGKSDQDPDPLITDNDFMTVLYNAGGTKQWTNLYHGTKPGGSDIPGNAVIDASGIYVAGGSEDTLTQKDGAVVKYDIPGTQVWAKNYNGDGDFSDRGNSLVIDANSNSYVGGYSFQNEHNRDASIVAINNSGAILCSYLYNGIKSDDDEFNQVAIDANGYIYATGYTKVTDQKSNVLTMKWNPATCDTVWTSTYNYVNQSDKGISIVVDAVGNVYVTGHSDSNVQDTIDNIDIVTIKYNSNGAQQWVQRFDGSGNLKDEPVRVIFDQVGNILVCGRAENVHDDDFVIIKYDASTGNPVWGSPVIYNGPFGSNDDRATDITVDSNNDIFVSGFVEAGSGNPDDAVIIKIDAAGNLQPAFYGYDGTGVGDDDAMAITHDNQDNIYVTIKTDVDPNPIHSNFNIMTVKFNNQLTQLWSTPPQYNSPINGDDEPTAILVDATGNVYVTGSSDHDTSNGRTNRNWITVRYNDQGIQTMVADFDGPAADDDVPAALAIRGTSMWVCGHAGGISPNQQDMATLMYDLTVGIPENNQLQNSAFFPNPMSETALLIFDNPSFSSWNLNIRDCLGRIVMSKKSLTGSELRILRGNLEAGIYLYEIESNHRIASCGKLILQ